MRKVFAVALALLLALVGMSAAAEDSGNQIVNPIFTGYWAGFENGYNGFCIDQKKTAINSTELE